MSEVTKTGSHGALSVPVGDTGPGLAADTGPGLAADTGPNVAADTGPDVAADTGPDVAADTGPDVAADTGPNVAADTGPNVAADTGPNVAADTGPVPATDASPDRFTAPFDAVPRRDPARLTLGDCWRAFLRRPSPPRLAAAVILAASVRIAIGQFSWRDLVVAAGIVVFTPPVEWLIHVFLLHAKPLRIAGREHDLLAARDHRAHHRAPAELDGVLIPPYALYIFLTEMLATSYLVSFPIVWVLGGNRWALGADSLLGAVIVLSLYEWTHFLIHTPYRPRRRYYKSIWRGHRLHHYKNERYWFGVTSTVADVMLHTAPDQSTVPKSGTARSLGA